VVVLEANRAGWGASGRNGGQVGVGPRADMTKYERTVGPDDAARVWEIGFAANVLVRELVARHGIDCDLSDGLLVCGKSARDATAEQHHAEHLARVYGHPKVRPVATEEARDLIGTDRLFGGYRDDQAAQVHPLKLALGLARAAVAAGAVIHERTQATAVEPGLVRTGAGAVRAGEVLIACNGYLDGLSMPVERRMLPINNYIIATEPLGEDRARRLNRDNLCVCDSRFVVNYFRLSPDRRMLWGGGETTGRRFPRDMAGSVRRRMLAIYPELADVAVTHAWGGTLAITGTRFALFRDLGGRVRAIGGWSGSGIHMGVMGGRIAADAIAGDVGDWNVLARMPTPAFPGGDWFRMPLLRLAMFWYGLRDRL
jgi:gamma-glutamylputrescine oxidase